MQKVGDLIALDGSQAESLKSLKEKIKTWRTDKCSESVKVI